MGTGARIADFSNINVQKVEWHNGCFEVYWSSFPYWFNRVTVYQHEDFINWLLEDTQQEKTVGIEFFIEEFKDIVLAEIANFHYYEIAISGLEEKNRLVRTIKMLKRKVDSLQQIVDNLRNILKTKV